MLATNRTTILLSLPAAVIAVVYPFFKRFFFLPQAFLGIAFSFGMPMAYAAVYDVVPPIAWWLLALNLFWVIAYDTEYAMVDRDDDLRLGLRTSAIAFGRFDVAAVMLCYAIYLAGMAVVGTLAAHGAAVLRGARRRARLCRLPLDADTASRTRRLLQGVPAQSLDRSRRVRRHRARLRDALRGVAAGILTIRAVAVIERTRPAERGGRKRGLPPVVGPDTRVLILGSFPGEASLAARQYYAHPRNHFWPLVGALIDVPLAALPYVERLARLRANGIGLWDTIVACQRRGSLDGAIRMAERGDVGRVRRTAPAVALVCFNGKTAARALPAWRDAGYRDAGAALVVAGVHAAVRREARGVAAGPRIPARGALNGERWRASRGRGSPGCRC